MLPFARVPFPIRQLATLCLGLAACSSGSGGSSTGASGSSGTAGTTSGGAAGACSVTTLAGNGRTGPTDGSGGPNGTASFNYPAGLAVDATGNVYVADQFDNLIRRIDATGTVTTVAGNGDAGFADGSPVDGGHNTLDQPAGLAIGTGGVLYIADTFNNRIRRLKGSALSTVAGNGIFGEVDGDGGPKGTAEFAGPIGVAIDSSGNLYVADEFNDAIRRVDASGQTTTIAGTPPTTGDGGGSPDDGGLSAFDRPEGIAVDASGNVFIADTFNSVIRKLQPNGTLTTLGAPEVTDGGDAGPPDFDTPTGIAVDAQGNLYVADSANNRIRKIDAQGKVTTLAGGSEPGFADGPSTTAQFSNPTSVALDAAGRIYVGDSNNNRVRVVSCP